MEAQRIAWCSTVANRSAHHPEQPDLAGVVPQDDGPDPVEVSAWLEDAEGIRIDRGVTNSDAWTRCTVLCLGEDRFQICCNLPGSWPVAKPPLFLVRTDKNSSSHHPCVRWCRRAGAAHPAGAHGGLPDTAVV